MIVQVRGCWGAGKSTLVRELLQENGGEVVEEQVFTRPDGKRERVPLWRCAGDLYVLGRYNLDGVSPGGGGDKINGEVGKEIVRCYADRDLPHLLWESAYGSTEVPHEPWLHELMGWGVVWGVLDTPFDECVRRVKQRRVERGRNVGKPFNEKRARQNHAGVHRQAQRAMAAGLEVYTLDHLRAYAELSRLLAYGGWQPTSRPAPEPGWGHETPFPGSETRRKISTT